MLGLRRGFGVVGGGCLAGGDLAKLPGNDTEISWSTTDGLESGSVSRARARARGVISRMRTVPGKVHTVEWFRQVSSGGVICS